MTSPSELLNRLAQFGVSVRAEGESLKVYPPSTWTGWQDAPAEARPLLGELKRRKAEVLAFLQNPTCPVADQIEIKLTKCRLFLTESELVNLLTKDPALWAVAIKRGKWIIRGRKMQERQTKKQHDNADNFERW